MSSALFRIILARPCRTDHINNVFRSAAPPVASAEAARPRRSGEQRRAAFSTSSPGVAKLHFEQQPEVERTHICQVFGRVGGLGPLVQVVGKSHKRAAADLRQDMIPTRLMLARSLMGNVQATSHLPQALAISISYSKPPKLLSTVTTGAEKCN